MFNLKEFEENVYAVVTQKVNEAFTELLAGDKAKIQSRGIQLYRAILKILHGVTEEVAVQILYGLLLDLQAKLGVED